MKRREMGLNISRIQVWNLFQMWREIITFQGVSCPCITYFGPSLKSPGTKWGFMASWRLSQRPKAAELTSNRAVLTRPHWADSLNPHSGIFKSLNSKVRVICCRQEEMLHFLIYILKIPTPQRVIWPPCGCHAWTMCGGGSIFSGSKRSLKVRLLLCGPGVKAISSPWLASLSNAGGQTGQILDEWESSVPGGTVYFSLMDIIVNCAALPNICPLLVSASRVCIVMLK